ncbi:MAG: S1 RNA-binding domain-containing protein [Oscillospiraceae bacterium]|nr:S1 RNA-binding domain-containing protein [Oscillospiraceae bacterium]
MLLEIGKIYDGKVRNITNYGAFVEISVEDKVQVGMVHISEISNTYVNDIREHLTEGQEVKVKVLNIDEQGKTSLSIKKAVEAPAKPRPQWNNNQRNSGSGAQTSSRQTNNNQRSFNSKQPAQELTFEDMLSRFKQNSEEKMCDLKRNIDSKRRNTSRRGK